MFDQVALEVVDPQRGVWPEMLQRFRCEQRDIMNSRAALRGRARSREHPIANPMRDLDQTFALELREGLADGFATDLQGLAENAFARQPVAPGATFNFFAPHLRELKRKAAEGKRWGRHAEERRDAQGQRAAADFSAAASVCPYWTKAHINFAS